MIKRSALTELAASQEKMMSNVAMLEFHCMQICVKHEAVALLPVNVEVEGEEYRIEDTAEVFMPEEHEDDLDKIYLVPKNNHLLVPVIKALYRTHPEFSQDIFRLNDVEEEEDEDKKERMGDGFVIRVDKEEIMFRKDAEIEKDENIYLIRLTMPPVTKSLRKTYHEMVENLFKSTKMKLDSERVKMKANVAPKTIGYTDKELKEINTKMDEIYNNALKEAERTRKEKDEEIEWGYNRYVERHGEYDDPDNNPDGNPDEAASSMVFDD